LQTPPAAGSRADRRQSLAVAVDDDDDGKIYFRLQQPTISLILGMIFIFGKTPY
jgi:hypothetical protein